MAAKSGAFSLILIVSLLSHSTTKTAATFVSPLTIPSCCSRVNPVKCYQDYKAAYGAKAAAEAGCAANAIAFALNAVNAAKTGCSGALMFFKSMKGGPQSKMAVTCTRSFDVAVKYLGQASMAMQGKTDMSKSARSEVQNSVDIAVKSVVKCTTATGNNAPDINNASSEPVKLCNIALNACKGIAA